MDDWFNEKRLHELLTVIILLITHLKVVVLIRLANSTKFCDKDKPREFHFNKI